MDRVTFGKRSLNAQRPRADRFVTPREYYPEIQRRVMWNLRCEQYVGDIWCAKYLQQKKYMSYLDEALGLEPIRPYYDDDKCVQFWPCLPRERSYLSTADSILDLPSYSYAAFPDLLDWSNDNVLVAALGRNYHKFSWRTQSIISQGITRNNIHCCKFDPRAELLLLGTDFKTVEIHDNALSKWLGSSNCNEFVFHYGFCSITSLDWSPTGNSYVIGCSRGCLTAATRDCRTIRSQRVVPGAILVVRVSPDARYVAAAAVNGRTVVILTWPGLKLFSSLNSDWTIKTLTWHPWRSALLGIGASSSSLHACVAMLDAPSGHFREFTLGETPYSLDSMLFSQKSGELVLSLWNTERAVNFPKTCSQLVVMSDPNSVVDQWGEGRSGLDRVRTMVFSPDGTKLATATADEDLIIWNFLPAEKNKKKKVSRRFHYSIPVFIDQTTCGTSLR